MLPGTRLEVQVFISCSWSDLGKAQGHSFFMWKPGTKQFLQFKYTVTISTLEEETELHYTVAHYLQTPLVEFSGGSPFVSSKHTNKFSFRCTDGLLFAILALLTPSARPVLG